jgi:hypothetical protein
LIADGSNAQEPVHLILTAAISLLRSSAGASCRSKPQGGNLGFDGTDLLADFYR